MPEDLCACDQSEAPDLAAWKREAGEAAPLDAAATKGPWRVSTQCHDERPHTEEVCDLVNGVWVVTDKRLRLCRDDAAFIAAARAGWPRDAARVGVLCAEVERLSAEVARERGRADEVLCDDTSLANTAQRLHAEVATLRAALLDAADGWDAARKSATPPRRADAETIARLRAIAACGAPKGESR